MKSGIELKKCITGLLQGNITVGELSDFIHFTRSIAETYLLKFRLNILNLYMHYGMSISDLSIDCIGEMFGRDEQDDYYIFKNFVQSLYHPLETIPENELFFAYKSFVLKITNAWLAKTYAQFDPAGARIHRNIKEAVKKSSNLTLHEDFRGYNIQISNGAVDEHLESFKLQDLESGLLNELSFINSIPEFLQKLANLFREQNTYQKSVRLIDLVKIVKKYYAGYRMQEIIGNGVDVQIDTVSIDRYTLERDVLRDIQNKIFSTYVLSGKMNKREAQALYSILSEIVGNFLREDFSTDSYYTIAEKHLSISKEEYNTTWRAKIEYLARLAREKLMLYFTDTL